LLRILAILGDCPEVDEDKLEAYAILASMDIGFWTALFGFSLFTDSLYNFIIASEFMIIMIPHMMLENIKLKA